jgi:hypothetical protein
MTEFLSVLVTMSPPAENSRDWFRLIMFFAAYVLAVCAEDGDVEYCGTRSIPHGLSQMFPSGTNSSDCALQCYVRDSHLRFPSGT